MKKNLKNLLAGIAVSIFITSCSALTAKQLYEKGDYIGALETTVKELNSAKSEIPLTIANEISSRIRETENRYMSIISNTSDLRTKANTYFELWQMGNIIEKNPILEKYTDFRTRHDNYRNLNLAIELIKRYAEEDLNSRINSLGEFITKLRKADVKNSQYSTIFESFARSTADIYINSAESLERIGKYKEAKEMYYKGYEAYRDFNNNYRDSQKRYTELTKIIDLADAEKYFQSAISLYSSGRFSEAKVRFEKARDIYHRYSMNRNVDQIDSYLKDIKRRIELNEANKYFDEAKRYYNSGHFDRAKSRFLEAKKIYDYYKNYTLSREIDVYLENIKYKIEIQIADKYFEEGQRNYNLQRYDSAKVAFEKARTIYISLGERSKVSQIDVYLENIRTRTGNNPANDFNMYYKQALAYLEKGNREYNTGNANYYYKLAIDNFKYALNYTNDYYKRNEINKYIQDLEWKIKNTNNEKNEYKFVEEYKKALEVIDYAKKQPTFEDENYYYKEALNILKKAIKLTNDLENRDQANELIRKIENKISENESAMRFQLKYYELYNKAKSYISIAESRINVYDRNKDYKHAINYLKEALKYTKDKSKINEVNKLIYSLESKVRMEDFNNDFIKFFTEGQEYLKMANNKIGLLETNDYYGKAMSSFEKAKRYTTDQRKINEINLMIKDIKNRIYK
ncbi:hypothetical protein [Streptobacillus moniliformis]|uniref:Tetratricopeptide domain protein n=1 Tax=Streptobacillus moniliformis (strain ATCC 14647 / DSM 12112 / NCTC 10651 / 9901) TaxID=519441 RepID=D1AYM9_STRM9|nr:hypothetical protein [Streptobacillus moniliformis]ACZ01405.1 Tetratricopeptide domain protein [Streptobacillus moniliformis DSM 12112]AVL43583.1 hypothetical protein CEP89_07160 [Streptobacillus moniliformis]SQA13435.1 Uncharacterised protein [Streptobacillus moniliformis]